MAENDALLTFTELIISDVSYIVLDVCPLCEMFLDFRQDPEHVLFLLNHQFQKWRLLLIEAFHFIHDLT